MLTLAIKTFLLSSTGRLFVLSLLVSTTSRIGILFSSPPFFLCQGDGLVLNSSLTADRKKLSRRLLFDKSANDDHERLILTKLKQQCGGQFTSKMEGMVS